MALLDNADHLRVSDAVAAAEASTDGEVVTIVARTSHDYADVAWAAAGLAALGMLALLLALPGLIDALVVLASGGWVEPEPVVHSWLLFLLVAGTFGLMRALLIWRPARLALVPPALRRARVAARAESLFRVGAERKTRGRTGVLIYLSLAEHRAEILADRAIADHVQPEAWGDAMGKLLDGVRAGDVAGGMAAAVTEVGILLARHFPHSADNPNELCDRLIEL